MGINRLTAFQDHLRILKYAFLALIAACSLVLLSGSDALSLTVEVSPDHIPINSLYHGSKITITGETQPGSDIIIKISSPPTSAHLRKKGKAGGILWMNIGELEFHPVSNVYLVFSTKDLSSILTRQQQDEYAIGYDAFERVVEVSPVSSEDEKQKWIREFIKFKEANNIYGIFPDAVTVREEDDKATYNLTVDWPYEAPPTEYRINVYAVKNHVIEEQAEKTLIVEKVGALKFLSNMAFNNAPVYGVVSIIVAIGAGFIVSLIFKGGGGGH